MPKKCFTLPLFSITDDNGARKMRMEKEPNTLTRGSERRLRYVLYIAKLPILFELFEQMKHFLRIKLKFGQCDKNNIIIWAITQLK
jgi:hypothetical protein